MPTNARRLSTPALLVEGLDSHEIHIMRSNETSVREEEGAKSVHIRINKVSPAKPSCIPLYTPSSSLHRKTLSDSNTNLQILEIRRLLEKRSAPNLEDALQQSLVRNSLRENEIAINTGIDGELTNRCHEQQQQRQRRRQRQRQRQ